MQVAVRLLDAVFGTEDNLLLIISSHELNYSVNVVILFVVMSYNDRKICASISEIGEKRKQKLNTGTAIS